MTRRKRTITILASVSAALLLIGAAVAAPAVRHHGDGRAGLQGGLGFGMGPGGGFGLAGGIHHALASLELTDEQKDRVKAILEDEGPRMKPLVDDVLQAKKALFEAVHAGEFDEKAVRAAAADTARAETELAVERARIVSRFREVLTPEQQERLDRFRRSLERRIEERLDLGREIWQEHASDFIDSL